MLNHTFVICAYGDSPYLEECILSLKEQTVSSTIILYTSTLSSYISNLCEIYAIPVYEGLGGSIGKDWNTALSFVETQYVTIAHQDDYYEPTYVEELFKKISSKTLIAFSDYYEFKGGCEVRENTNLRIKRMMLNTLSLFPTVKWWRRRILAFGNPISCPAVTYNLERLADFKFDSQMRVSVDWYAWSQIAEYEGRFDYIPKQLMFHRIHGESETSQKIKDKTRSKEDLFMYEQFWPAPLARWISKQYERSQKSNDD
ncbi:glycosyltransferase family 2 protein [Streptococcus acidominimus]|uniref:Glycosyltransferase family 2 protein n=1 Tax=Streptococcus acidominimus TaxID=1326 RepID=A0A4Y9FPD6_STRAI|nr:glycosyltransferase family 2 protein [Streptococcus acidominimus]MBF0818577.1 glycosyltransferase family 2 protein [Streptococcus acidominimus]MBF0838217.1 glycosyltransferase family 2 protein [Streptococcus acidominimus]MBF0847997.1 glycosyltransferase family 2 protein [Streptococcus danieliae]TFU31077.1 glycosyltransferase family 2 protein [Streptococcus acidominimus]